MKNVNVNLRPIVNGMNLPTVIKTAILPGDTNETLFIASLPGEILLVRDQRVETFLNIHSRIIELGTEGGYDERGLIGMAFHPNFTNNGLFYLHYSLAGSQGPGAFPYFAEGEKSSPIVQPDPCNPRMLHLKWLHRETEYDHIDTVEEWILSSNGQSQKRRTILNLRRPFSNHNGIDSLHFSPETKRLVLTTGDGGLAYDPFNLAQQDLEIAGKILEIDVDKQVNVSNPPVVTRFDDLPLSIQETLNVIVKGVRNPTGIAYERYNNQYIKYVGNVGQDLVEAIYAFVNYKPVSVTNLIQEMKLGSILNQDGVINLGWRGWEGSLPTMILRRCPTNASLNEKIMATYQEAVSIADHRLSPLTCYYHEESRPDKIAGTALTKVKPYLGTSIPDLTRSVIFTEWSRKNTTPTSRTGALAYTRYRSDGKLNDYGIININHNFASQPAYFVSLGTNLNQTRIYLGVYSSSNVKDYGLGMIFEIIP